MGSAALVICRCTLQLLTVALACLLALGPAAWPGSRALCHASFPLLVT